MRFGKRKRAGLFALSLMTAFLTALGAGRAIAQPSLRLVVEPEVVRTRTVVTATVSGARPGTQVRLFASLFLGETFLGPFSSECGDFGFRLALGEPVKHIRTADGVTDQTGTATLRFRMPARLPPRYNGIKVYFQAAGFVLVRDSGGNCSVRTATTNVDCSTIRLDLK